MIPNDIFEQFSRNALNPQILDELFEDVARKPSTNKPLFSTAVDLMGSVVRRIRPSTHAAFQARAETVGASIDAVKGARPAWLPGYRTRIISPAPSTGWRDCGRSAPGHCPAMLWSHSIPD